MTDAAAAKTFVEKWAYNTQKESSASKEHFVDLCHLLGQTTPNDLGSGPNTYCFEKSLTKVGGQGQRILNRAYVSSSVIKRR